MIPEASAAPPLRQLRVAFRESMLAGGTLFTGVCALFAAAAPTCQNSVTEDALTKKPVAASVPFAICIRHADDAQSQPPFQQRLSEAIASRWPIRRVRRVSAAHYAGQTYRGRHSRIAYRDMPISAQPPMSYTTSTRRDILATCHTHRQAAAFLLTPGHFARAR